MPAAVVFLREKTFLARQVAEVLLRGHSVPPIDLGATQVWIPTATAGRQIRHELATLAARMNTGVLTPRFMQPMQALLPDDPNTGIATRAEREIAWARILRDLPHDRWDRIVPSQDVVESVSGVLGVGGMLCDVCDLLVEGELDPTSSLVTRVMEENDERWSQLRPLYLSYLDLLRNAGLADPNAARLDRSAIESDENRPQRVVVACIPDLPTIAARQLERLDQAGVRIEILVWQPGTLAGGFDSWGRPIPGEWSAVPLPVEAGQISVAHQPEDEAGEAIDYLAGATTAGDFSICLADETLASTFTTEILRRDRIPFLPAGKKLANSEPAIIALEWKRFQSSRDLRVLRRLLQCPHFSRWLGRACQLASSQLLSTCDFMIAVPLAENLDQVRDFLQSDSGDAKQEVSIANARKLVLALNTSASTRIGDLLQEAWAGSGNKAELAAVRQLLELLDETANSAVLADWPEAIEGSFLRALRSARIFEAAPPRSVQLAGWLEVPWMEGSRLAICGCSEGLLPSSVNEHPFLPDSRRTLLGLIDNEKRLARDAYLLNCLLLRHGAENLRFSFARFGQDGTPALPSRLLLRCSSESLPERVLQVFGPAGSTRSQPARHNDWRWDLPDALRRKPPEKIGPTAFKDYLTCPFRFYFKQILRADGYDADPREMDARRFGQLVHLTLEAFGKKTRNESDPDQIESALSAQLAVEALRMLGPSPAPAVRVQLEAIKVRLGAFARLQATEYAKGWRIIDVEKRFSSEHVPGLKIGPLSISAQIDRIEEHSELGLRIMDYKTFSQPKTPEDTHFGPATANAFLDEAQVLHLGKPKCWLDLQLPLYRWIAEQHYAARPIQAAYFLLPADPASTAIVPLELTDEEYQSAIACAEVIAKRVSRGIFWPPQPPSGGWADPYAALLLNGRAERCLTNGTINFLKGQL